MRKDLLCFSTSLMVCSSCFQLMADNRQNPNVIIILADDLGYGDLECYGAKRVRTPEVNKLAAEGIRFTNTYATASTSTPSRYSLLTGEYAFRNKVRIADGDAPALIQPDKFTLASLFKLNGYYTGIVGKWHLGLGDGRTDYNLPIRKGPNEIGFDYSFIIPATVDRVPCVYIENGNVVNYKSNDPIFVDYKKPFIGVQNGRSNPELMTLKPMTNYHNMAVVNGIGRIGYMKGGADAIWKDENIADDITNKAVQFIEKNQHNPFFLFFSTHDIHAPRVPHPRFKNTSQCGVRGDAIHQFDFCVGEIINKLEELSLDKNTIVIITSDNGPFTEEGYIDHAQFDLNGHRPTGQLTGSKYHLYEGSLRIPFIIWGSIFIKKPGISNYPFSFIDIFASFANYLEFKLKPDYAPDSRSILKVLQGEWKNLLHNDPIILQNNQGDIAIRMGKWKYIPKESLSFTDPSDELYNVQMDPAETTNLNEKYPKLIKKMKTVLMQLTE